MSIVPFMPLELERMPSNQIVVVEREHAKISPSGFERAENCTQSVRLSAYAQPRLAGPEARIGTAKHWLLLDKCLTENLETFELGDIETIKVDGHEIKVTDELLDDVQFVLDRVREIVPEPRLIEAKVEFEFADAILDSPLFGYIDVATAEGPPWIVADAKFGVGLVEADTIQLAIYLLCLVGRVYPNLDREGLAGTTVIIQPNARAEPVRTHDYTFADLREIKRRVIAALTRIKNQEWSYKLGPWCRHCTATGICPHLHAMMRDPALTLISPSPEAVAQGEITREMLEDGLDRAPILEHALKQLYATAEDYMIHGGKLRNQKLVRKRTTRKWINELKAVNELKALGVEPYSFTVISPAQAEKRLPKGKRGIIEKLSEQPLGELTAAPKNDPKPEVDVVTTLKAALRSRAAAGYLAAAKSADQNDDDKGEL
jgi:hypothetical protein